MTRNTEHMLCIRRAIEEAGARVVALRITRGGHRAFDFEVAGRRGTVTFATSPRQGRDLRAISTARRVVRMTAATVRP
jgi:hypothetical protein